MNLIKDEMRSYKTYDNALKALQKALGSNLDRARWLIGVTSTGRFVPTLVGIEYVSYIHVGIAVVN